MLEFKDGSFSDIQPAEEVLDRLQDQFLQECVRSVHFGSVAELEGIKSQATFKEKLRLVEENLEEFNTYSKRTKAEQ